MQWKDWTPEAIVGVIAVVAAIGIFLAERKTKGLALAVVTDRAIVSQASAFPLEVLHNGIKVLKPRLVVLRLANAGEQPITSADFEQPLRVRLVDASILSTETTLTRPHAFKPSVLLDGPDAVRLDPCLMNQRDMVEIQMLVDGKPSQVLAEARISGVQDVEQVRLPRTSWDEPWRFSKFDVIIGALPPAIFAGLGISLFLTSDNLLTQAAAGVLVLLAGVVWPWYLWRSERRNRLFLEV